MKVFNQFAVSDIVIPDRFNPDVHDTDFIEMKIGDESQRIVSEIHESKAASIKSLYFMYKLYFDKYVASLYPLKPSRRLIDSDFSKLNNHLSFCVTLHFTFFRNLGCNLLTHLYFVILRKFF